jgi:hypothetical protein
MIESRPRSMVGANRLAPRAIKKRGTDMRFTVKITAIFFALSMAASAGDDPSIKDPLRKGIQQAMSEHIDGNTIKSRYPIYDAVDGKLLRLEFKGLHKGIVKKAEFYVSCADFVDPAGRKYDLDFLVVDDAGKLKATQGIVHSIDGVKRKYHLEQSATEGE